MNCPFCGGCKHNKPVLTIRPKELHFHGLDYVCLDCWGTWQQIIHTISNQAVGLEIGRRKRKEFEAMREDGMLAQPIDLKGYL